MPRLRNVLEEPVVRLLEDRSSPGEQREALLAVEGLVCDLCAARVKQALHRVPGVTQVEFSPEGDRFRVHYRSSQSQGPALSQTAASTVVAPYIRQIIGRHARRLPLVRPGP